MKYIIGGIFGFFELVFWVCVVGGILLAGRALLKAWFGI